MTDTAGLCVSQEDPNNSPTNPPPDYSTIPGTVPLYQGRQSGPPPSYDDVTNPEAEPPTYNSLFGQVQEARRTSSSFVEFLRRLFLIIFGTLGCTVFFATTVVIPIAMIAIGATHLYDCTIEPYIPVYLIVGGIFGVLKNFRSCCLQCTKTEEERQQGRPEDSMLNCFLFAWFIAGCVWIYRAYQPDYDNPLSERYCDKTVYLFAFWLVTSTYIMLALVSCGLCCLTLTALLVNPE